MAKQRHSKWRARWGALVLGALVASLAVGSVAYADDTTPDGDGAVPVALLDLNFGSVCNGVSTVDTVLIAIQRNEAVPDDGQNNTKGLQRRCHRDRVGERARAVSGYQ